MSLVQITVFDKICELITREVDGVAAGALRYSFWISIRMRQWSLGPHSSGVFSACTVICSWKPREAKT